MPAYHDDYLGRKDVAECVTLFCKLLESKMIKVNDKFNWPVKYEQGFTAMDLATIITAYANAAGFTISVDSTTLTITGTV